MTGTVYWGSGDRSQVTVGIRPKGVGGGKTSAGALPESVVRTGRETMGSWPEGRQGQGKESSRLGGVGWVETVERKQNPGCRVIITYGYIYILYKYIFKVVFIYFITYSIACGL